MPLLRATPRVGLLLLGALLVCASAGCRAAVVPDAGRVEARCRAARAPAGAGPAMEWVLTAPRDEARLRAWCAAVGPPVTLSPSPAPRPPRIDSIAVLTWNVHVGGGDLVRLVADLRAGRLTGGQEVRHFVLLLQEVHRADPFLPSAPPGSTVPARVEEAPPSGPRRDVVETARRLGLALVYVPSMRNGEREDRGNAILSTLPLHDLRAIELPYEAQRRVAVAATLGGLTGGGAPWRLQVASAHLDTRSTGGRAWATVGMGRRRQALALADALRGDLPTLVAGDLNTWSLAFLEGALPLLRSRFPDTPLPLDRATFATVWGLRRRLDHMFFRLPEGWTGRLRRVDDRYGSDHYPLIGWVWFGGDGG